MVNKRFLLGILIIMPVFGVAVAGCDNGSTSTGESDTWSDVTDLAQMDGTWKGTYNRNMTVREVLEQMGETWTPQMQAAFGNMRVNSRENITVTIDASAETLEISVISIMTFSGGNINLVWPILRESLESFMEEGVTLEFIDATHSVIMTYNTPEQTLSEEDITEMLDSGLQINQNGTKIKVPANFLVQGTPELVFIKQ
jgi:hypothetical protein